MGAKIGTIDFNGGYVGGTAVDKLYCGSTLLWVLGDIPLTYIANGEDSTSGSTRDIVFNTGVQSSDTLKIEVKFRILNTVPTQVLLGCINRTENLYCQYLIREGMTSFQTYANQGNTASGLTTDDHTAVLFNENNHNKVILDGVESQSLGTIKQYPTDATIGLFGRYSTTSSDVKCYGGTRLYYVKIWDGETLIRDYVPVLHNQVPCFRDNVSGGYIYKRGSAEPYYE